MFKRITFIFQKLKYRFFIFLVIFGVLPILVLNLFAYNTFYYNVLDSSKATSKKIIQQIDTNINAFVKETRTIAFSLKTSQELRDLLSYNNHNEYLSNKRKIQKQLSSLSITYSDLFDDIIIIDNESNVHGNGTLYEIELPVSSIGKSFNYEEWLGKRDIGEFRKLQSDKNIYPYITVIGDPYYKKNYGLLVLNLKRELFEQSIDSIHFYEFPSSIYILDTNLNIVYVEDDHNIKLDHILPNINPEMKNDFFVFNDGNNEMFATYLLSPVTNYYILRIISIDDLTNDIIGFRKTIILISLLGIILSIVASIFISSYLTNKFDTLTSGFKSFNLGNLDTRIVVNGHSEIDEVCNDFNHMVIRLKNLIHTVYEKELENTNLRFEALKSQINPHFLYNVLDSINWMLIDKKQYEISTAVSTIGGLFRYNTTEISTEVHISKEVKYLGDYLYIQKIRFHDKLQYNISLPANIEDVFILRMLLQPLVENSIIHGIEKTGEPINIDINFSRNQHNIHVDIIDNGPGIPENKLKYILLSLSPNSKVKSPDDKVSHIGIKNVHKRLLHYYGNKCGLVLNSEVNRGTHISFEIPIFYQIDEN